MFALVTRNANGSIRVSPFAVETRSTAYAQARKFSTRFGKTVTVLDLSGMDEQGAYVEPLNDGVCRGTTRKGNRCSRGVTAESLFCSQHSN